MRSFAMMRALLLASIGMATMPGSTSPAGEVVNSAPQPGKLPGVGVPTTMQKTKAAELRNNKRSGKPRAHRYPSGGCTVAEGKRRAAKRRNVRQHKQRARG